MPAEFGKGRLHNNKAVPRIQLSFLVVLQQCTNHNRETTDQTSFKFCVYIIFWSSSCLIIQLYLPGGTKAQEWVCHVGICGNIYN